MPECAVRERSTILSTNQVRAVLDGRETQHRVPVMFSNSTVLGYTNKRLWGQLCDWDQAWVDGPPDPIGGGDGYQYLHVPAKRPDDPVWYRVRSRSEPGDRLWVKEAFDLPPGEVPDSVTDRAKMGVGYGADPDWYDSGRGRVWPATKMPRWASRITLEITGVRVERLQDMSRSDAGPEGFYAEGTVQDEDGFDVVCPKASNDMALGLFRDSWNCRYAKRGYGWNVNPWVWVELRQVVVEDTT